MEAARLPWLPLGSMLLRAGLVTPEQVEEALAEKERTGQRLGEIIVDRGLVSAQAIARVLAEQAGLEYIDLARTEIDPEAAALLSDTLARRYSALPVKFLSENVLLIAVADPTNVGVSDDLRLALGYNLRVAVAAKTDLERALARVYRSRIELSAAEPPPDLGTSVPDDLRDQAASAPTINLVNSLLSQAIDDGASDVHFEPQEGRLVVRARIDGVTREVISIPKHMQAAVTSRLKIMGDLDIAERRAPQDGRVSVRFGGQPIDLRMAVLPTTYGEQVVLRILQQQRGRLRLSELGITPEAEASFGRALRQPFGAVILCGPTGSGKTTTLYAALDLLNEEGRVLMTIEDPVEYQLPGVCQVEVNTKSGLTFARGLRTILRSDPDVLLVGEIRDEETARIAIQSAMTGHLVLTSLHTQQAASSVARLKDMGVEPALIASSINCIVAQRLARRLCTECREPFRPAIEEATALGAPEVAGELLHRARGCAQCANTGYSGRVGLFEVMPIEGRMRPLLESSTEAIFTAAVEQGMKTLRQEGIRLCLEGISSLEEIRRVTGDRFL